MAINMNRMILAGLIITILIVPVLAANDSIKPSAKRGAAYLPADATGGIGSILDLAMFIVAVIAVIAALTATSMAIFSKTTERKNEGFYWLGYIVFACILLGIVLAIINAILFT